MHVNGKFTIEGECRVAERTVGFCCYSGTLLCIDQDSGSGDDFGLVGVKNRNVVEIPIQRSSTLPRHQRHVGPNRWTRKRINCRKSDTA